jgi:small GTP-binding protein domain
MRKILSYLGCFLFIATAFMFGQAVNAGGGGEYKVIFVGDSNVGKTSIVNAMRGYNFDEWNFPTVRAAFTKLNCMSTNGLPITINVWDTAGQERFHTLVPMYLQGADVAVVVCSKDDQKSQEHISYWVNFINEYGLDFQKNNIIVVLNKSDLLNGESNNVNENSFPDCHFIVTSAKTGENISELLNLIVDIAANSVQEEQSEGALSLHQLNNKQAKKGCC